jgi:hypothetical protein
MFDGQRCGGNGSDMGATGGGKEVMREARCFGEGLRSDIGAGRFARKGNFEGGDAAVGSSAPRGKRALSGMAFPLSPMTPITDKCQRFSQFAD